MAEYEEIKSTEVDLFSGDYIDVNAGSTLAFFSGTHSTVYPSQNGSAIALVSTGEDDTQELETKQFKNLYKKQGWVELASFKLPDNWVWDECAVKPENNTYTLCGRTINGSLEWQFGNLKDSTPPGDISGDLDSEVEDADTFPSINISTGYAEFMVSQRAGGFSKTRLRWAGKEVSEVNMLLNGKLRVSCEPVYIGMFSVSMSYLSGKTDETVADSNYSSISEVSPVWFLFASIKDDLLNIVAIEHTIKAGDNFGNTILSEDITDPYKLYGESPKFLETQAEDVPPESYTLFNRWLYTSFILPPSEYLLHITSTENSDKLADVNNEEGWYYVSADGTYHRVSDALVESGCRNSPCPEWMALHSVDDSSDPQMMSISLCSFADVSNPVIFINFNAGSRVFLDNLQHKEYRWQNIEGRYRYVSYKDSRYIADISRADTKQSSSIAYLPVGSRNDESNVTYSNIVLRINAKGRCVSFSEPYIAQKVQ